MPTEVGIHHFTVYDERKAWIPTSVGMSDNGSLSVTRSGYLYYFRALRAA